MSAQRHALIPGATKFHTLHTLTTQSLKLQFTLVLETTGNSNLYHFNLPLCVVCIKTSIVLQADDGGMV